MCLLFLICSWLFMKLQKKCLKKSLMSFQCHDWDTKFSYQIDYFWIFMKLQQKTWRNIYLHFNAKTVIQHFLYRLVVFGIFWNSLFLNLISTKLNNWIIHSPYCWTISNCQNIIPKRNFEIQYFIAHIAEQLPNCQNIIPKRNFEIQ